MISLTDFEPYNLRDLEASMYGVRKEIDKRNNRIRHMRFYKKHPEKAVGVYSDEFIAAERPVIEREIVKLKIIHIELSYLYELSKLKAA